MPGSRTLPIILLCMIVLAGVSASAQAENPQYLTFTVAGSAPPPNPTPGTSLSLGEVTGVTADSVGNVYFSSLRWSSVFKLDAAGVVTRIAGTGRAAFSEDGGPAIAADLYYPGGLAVDQSGNLYIAEGYRVRRVTPDGRITTVAGNGLPGHSGDGGMATSAAVQPTSLARDAAGDLYIASIECNCVRRVNAAGIITTVAGDGTPGYSGDGGRARSARLNLPTEIAFDVAGNLYIADAGNLRIRKVSASGTITTVAGNGTSGLSGDNGPATKAQFSNPRGVAVDASGALYIADGYRIRKVSNAGRITTIAGSTTNRDGYAGDGGLAVLAQLTDPRSLSIDPWGNLYVADANDWRIRKISLDGTISTVAGGGTGDGGPSAFAYLHMAMGIARDTAGNLYVADTRHHRVRKITPAGVITTVAGKGSSGFSGDGGPAVSAELRDPMAVAVDAAGNLYIADSGNQRVRKVGLSGIITTFAGNGESGSAPTEEFHGARATAVPISPDALAVGATGALYVAHWSGRISRVTPAGIVDTVAGDGNIGYSGDNGPALRARFGGMPSLAFDAAGNLYVADSANNRIRKVSTNGIVTTVAGNGTAGGGGDGGPAKDAMLNYPRGIAVDSQGSLYIADTGNARIRRVTADGIIRTIAGCGPPDSVPMPYPGDGQPASLGAFGPATNLVVDPVGRIYAVTDSDRILGLSPTSAGPVLTVEAGHEADFRARQIGASYRIVVNNATGAAATKGAVTVAEYLPAGLTLVSMAGDGWACTANTCTRGDALAGNSSYPPITVTVNVDGNPPAEVLNRVTVSGGSTPATAGASDSTAIGPAAAMEGRVLDSSGNPLGSITVALGGAETRTITTDAGGLFRFLSLSAGASYTVTPRSEQYGFAPASREIQGLASDMTLEPFIGTPAAAITAPADGSSVTGSCVTLTWTTVTGHDSYFLKVGRSAGSGEYFERWLLAVGAQEVCGLPEDGSRIYVQLFTAISGQWFVRSYTYLSPIPPLARMKEPAAGAAITGGCVVFAWTPGDRAQGYALKVGASPGSREYFDAPVGMQSVQQVCGLPEDGSTVHVVLSTMVDGQWGSNSYSYTSVLSPLAVLTSPVNGSTLSGSCATFSWRPGAGNLAFYLRAGRNPGSGEYFDGWIALNTSQQVCGFPADGSRVFVQLWTYIAERWAFRSYTFVSGTP